MVLFCVKFHVLWAFSLEGLILMPLFLSFCGATFPIRAQVCLQLRPRRAALCMGKSGNFHGHFLLLKLQSCISSAELPCSKKLASDKDSVLKIINIRLKSIGLDGYKPRAEFCPNCSQNFWIFALHCNLGTDSVWERKCFWCNLILTWTSS